jgi:hypothetical protein
MHRILRRNREVQKAATELSKSVAMGWQNASPFFCFPAEHRSLTYNTPSFQQLLRLYSTALWIQGVTFMSAPSRRPEIRRRRVRKEKITKLRKRIATTTSESDRSRLQAKLAKLARISPGQPLVKA